MRSSERIAPREPSDGFSVPLTTRRSMVAVLFLVVWFCIQSGASVGNATQSRPPVPLVSYEVRIDPEHNHRLSVRIAIPAPTAASISFEIPAWTPGYYQILHFEKNIEHVRAADDTGRLLSVAHPVARRWNISLLNGASRRITLTYDVIAADKGLGFFGSQVDTHRRIAYINGASALMYVVGLTQAPVSLALSLPQDWKCAAPLDSGPSGSYQAATYDELIDSPLQLGSFDSFHFEVNHVPFQCVLVGNHHAERSKVTDILSRAAREAMAVFGSTPFQRYIFFYHIGEEGFQGGLEHHNSTVIHLDDPIEDGSDDEFLTTSVHELFHAWNVKSLRPVGLGPFDYTQPVRTPSLWFAEGVTDYYADLLPVRAGLRSRDWFLQQLTERIRQFDNTPARVRVSLEQASLKAWEGQSEGYDGLSYYVKGSLVGCYFDLRMRSGCAGECSLDSVMKDLYTFYALRGTAYPDSAINSAICRAGSIKLKSDYSRYVAGMDDIPWEECLHAAGVRVNRVADGYLGVSFAPDVPEDETDDSDETERAAIVHHVEAAYPAAHMGVRPGDRIVAINGQTVRYGLVGAIARSLPAGLPVTITLKRNGKLLELSGMAATRYSHHTLSFLAENDLTPEMRRVQQSWFASRADAKETGLLHRRKVQSTCP